MNPCFKLITTIGFCSFVILSLALVGKNLVPKKEPTCAFGIKNILIQMVEFALRALIKILETMFDGFVTIVQIPLRLYMMLPWWIQMGTDMGAGIHLHASLYGAPHEWRPTHKWVTGDSTKLVQCKGDICLSKPAWLPPKQESESSKPEKEKEYPTPSAITDLLSREDKVNEVSPTETKDSYKCTLGPTGPVCFPKGKESTGLPALAKMNRWAMTQMRIDPTKSHGEEPKHPLNACRTDADPIQCTKELLEFYKTQREQFMSHMNYYKKLADEVPPTPANTTPAVNETLFPSCRPDSDPVKCDNEILDYYKTHRHSFPPSEVERCKKYMTPWLWLKIIMAAPKTVRRIIFSLHMGILALVMLCGSKNAGIGAAVLNLVFQIYIDGSVLMYLPFVLLWMRWRCGLFDRSSS